MTSSWRSEDLLDLERCGLAADLASTNLGSGGSGTGWGQGSDPHQDTDLANTYDFSEVLDNLLDKENELSWPALSTLATSMATPTTLCASDSVAEQGSCRQVGAVLRAPSAYGIKADQERVTYLNRGQSYEIQLQLSSATPVLYKSTLSLSFCELRWQNSEREHFEQWSRDHPQDRLLQIDSIGCAGLSSVRDDESCRNRVHFSWTQSNAVVAVKINCLSTEFAAKKHGGEKGVLLRLYLEMWDGDSEVPGQHSGGVYRGACAIKVFKDKGGDRKQRQDQAKVEKLGTDEQAKYHASEANTKFELVAGYSGGCGLAQSASCTPMSDSGTLPSCSTPGASPYYLATPPSLKPAVTTPHLTLTACVSVEDTQKWLMLNRFGQFSSLFANYTGADFLCMTRQDLMDLCGQADGIRLYNSLRSRVLKTLYVRFKPEDKVYQAVCLEALTAHELLMQLLDKLVWLDASLVVSFVRLTSGGLLVRIDDTVVNGMHHEDSFLLQTIKEESGCYQVVLEDCVPPDTHQQVRLSLHGSAPRH